MPHDLARQLVAAYPDVWGVGTMAVRPSAPGWWWRVLRVTDGAPTVWTFEDSEIRDVEDGDAWPADVVPCLEGDDATAGVLLARLASVALPVVHTPAERGEPWVVRLGGDYGPEFHTGPTLGHACAAALVALTTPPTE